MSIVELATDCKRVYIHSCCLEESSSVVIERVARTIVQRKKQDVFVRDRESTSIHIVKATTQVVDLI
jgi:hypothetical protein